MSKISPTGVRPIIDFFMKDVPDASGERGIIEFPIPYVTSIDGRRPLWVANLKDIASILGRRREIIDFPLLGAIGTPTIDGVLAGSVTNLVDFYAFLELDIPIQLELFGEIQASAVIEGTFDLYNHFTAEVQITSSTSAALRAEKSLAGAVNCTAVLGAVLQRDKSLLGSAAAGASASGLLQTNENKALAASLAITASVVGAAVRQLFLAGSSSNSVTVAGLLRQDRYLGGNASVNTGVAGTLRAELSLAGNVLGQAIVSGGFTSDRVFAGTVSAGAQATADIRYDAYAAGISTGTVSVVGDITRVAALSSNAQPTVTITGSIRADKVLEASVTPNVTVVAQIRGDRDIQGTALAGASITGALTVGNTLSAAVSAGASAVGSIIAKWDITGSLSINAQAQGAIRADADIAGAVTDIVSVSGQLSFENLLAANVSPSVSISANLLKAQDLFAISNAIATSIATLSVVNNMAGTASNSVGISATLSRIKNLAASVAPVVTTAASLSVTGGVSKGPALVGTAQAAAATITIPAHQAGDIIVMFAFRDGSTTQSALPTNVAWTSKATWTTTSVAARVASFVATGSGTASGTWLNATSLVCHVYRPRAGNTIALGAIATSGLATNAFNYPALTLEDATGLSWVMRAAGHRSLDKDLETAPTGYTQRQARVNTIDEIASFDTNGTVTANPTQFNRTLTGTAAGWASFTLEIKEIEAVVVPPDPGTMWDPNELAVKPIEWFKTNEGVSENPVSSIANYGSAFYSLAQFTASYRPTMTGTLNGLPVMAFDGVDDYLATFQAQTIPSGPFHAFVVMKRGSTGRNDTPFMFGSDAGSSTDGLAIRWRANDALDAYGNGRGAVEGTTTTGPAASVASTSEKSDGYWHMLEASFNSSTNIWVDGIQKTTTTNVSGTVPAYTNMFLGAGDGAFLGSFAELIVLPYTPTEDERLRIEGYLAWKWGDSSTAATNLVGKLPVGHPYKSVKPAPYPSTMGWKNSAVGTPTYSTAYGVEKAKFVPNGTENTLVFGSSMPNDTGKYYFEIVVDKATDRVANVGIFADDFSAYMVVIADTATDATYAISDQVRDGGTGTPYETGITANNGDVIGFAYDPTNKKCWARINNGPWLSSNGTGGNPTTNTGGTSLAAATSALVPFASYQAYTAAPGMGVTLRGTTSANTVPSGYIHLDGSKAGTNIFNQSTKTGGGTAQFDNTPATLGFIFAAFSPITITHVAFWKFAADTTTTRTVGVWNTAGTLVASGTSVNEPVGISQWIQVPLDTPLVPTVATLGNYTSNYYTAGFYAPTARYGSSSGYYSSGYYSADNAVYAMSGSETPAGNGVFKYVSGMARPDSAFGNSDYWVDIRYTVNT